MPKRYYRSNGFLLLLLSIILSIACSIKPPEVTVTGEKTALERQLLGEHKKLPEEIWSIGAVSTSSLVPPTESDSLQRSIFGEVETTLVKSYSPERLRYLRAEASRIFNKDDVDDFKKEGIVGENNRGYLEVVDSAKLRADSTLAVLVGRVVTEENRSRRVLMEWYVSLRQDLTEQDLPQVEASFAQRNREAAKPGELIQDEAGSWRRK
jgi:uncharacterized protein YdbL (DUF1318 family)